MPRAPVDHGRGGAALRTQVGRAASAAGTGFAEPTVHDGFRPRYSCHPASPPGRSGRDVPVAGVPDGEPPWPTRARNPSMVVPRGPGWRGRNIRAGRNRWAQRAPPAALDPGRGSDRGTWLPLALLWLVCHSVSRLPWMGRFGDCERPPGLAIVSQVWLPPIARRRVNSR